MVGRLRCDEAEQACEGAVIAHVTVLSRCLSGGTGEATNTTVKTFDVLAEVKTGHL
jgi:hypothetical protein